MKHLTEEDLILLYYREPDAPPSAHLAECPECREAADALRRTLDLCVQWTPPEPEPDFGRAAWARLAPQLEDRRPRLWWRGPLSIAVAAALLAAVFLAGRASRRPAPPIAAGLSDQARSRILAIALADHFDRADMLLTEISNAPDAGDGPERAADLVEESRLMRRYVADGGTLAVMDDLDRLLTELTHTTDIEGLRRRMTDQSILFKVRIVESNLRMEGQKS